MDFFFFQKNLVPPTERAAATASGCRHVTQERGVGIASKLANDCIQHHPCAQQDSAVRFGAWTTRVSEGRLLGRTTHGTERVDAVGSSERDLILNHDEGEEEKERVGEKKKGKHV